MDHEFWWMVPWNEPSIQLFSLVTRKKPGIPTVLHAPLQRKPSWFASFPGGASSLVLFFSFLGNWHVKKYQAYYMIKEHQCKEMYLYIYVYHMHIHVYKYMYVFIHIRYIFIYTRIICIINYLEYRFAFTVYPKMLAVVQHTCPVRLSPTTHLHRCLAYSSWPNKAKKKWCCSPGGRWAMP